MSDLRPRVRRLRSDAIRSRRALVEAAIDVLAAEPDADLARVAAHAGLSRQTLYAHFGSRAGLLDAVVDHVTEEVVRVFADLDLDEGSAHDALLRYLDAADHVPDTWGRVAAAATQGQTAAESAELHVPVVAPLVAVVRRGQAAGELNDEVPAEWLVEAIIALAHAAFGMGARGALPGEEARAALRSSVLRLCAPTPG